jgi:energy-coupling factor transport system ATP-binding protein
MKLDADEVKKRVLNAMTLVGLDPELFSERSPFDLSGGERRRAAIAGVLAMHPKYLVLDEPMAGLDPLGRREILALLEKLRSESHCTIIMISHSMDDIANHATKVLVLERGSLFLLDTPQEVFSHADELEKIGLSVPGVTKICVEMNRRGIEIPASVCTEEAFLDWIREVKAHA